VPAPGNWAQAVTKTSSKRIGARCMPSMIAKGRLRSAAAGPYHLESTFEELHGALTGAVS
jgi:hypothetical protein